MSAFKIPRGFIVVALFLVALMLSSAGGPLAVAGADPKDAASLQGTTLATAGLNKTLAPPHLSDFVDVWVDSVNKYSPAVAYNPKHNEYLVVWENDRGATRDIYARRVGGDGTLKSWFTIAHNAGKVNWQPDVVYNPEHDEYLVVYTYEVNNSVYDLYARRVSWNGGWMSVEYPVLADPQRQGRQWVPSVAYNPIRDEYLVVYENYISNTRRDIGAQRLKIKDVALESLSWSNIAGAANQVRMMPDVAFNTARNEYLIAYTYQFPTDGDIWGKTATFNLGMLSSEIKIVENTNDQSAVALASIGDEYLAVWEDGPGGSYRTIYARRIRGDGHLESLIKIVDYPNKAHVEPAVAFGPVHGYLITWRYASALGSGDDIYGRKLRPGTDQPNGGEFMIDAGSGSQRAPAVACSYTGACLVVEEDGFASAYYQIRGRFVLAYRALLPIVIR